MNAKFFYSDGSSYDGEYKVYPPTAPHDADSGPVVAHRVRHVSAPWTQRAPSQPPACGQLTGARPQGVGKHTDGDVSYTGEWKEARPAGGAGSEVPQALFTLPQALRRGCRGQVAP